MKEYMFFIRKNSNSQETLSAEQHHNFVKSCELYIGKLKEEGKLISAQPIVWSGSIISVLPDGWQEAPYNELGEVIGGYYHILADSFDEAVEIAKANPEFVYNKDTRIEVRPIKMKEDSTGFVYPAK